MMKNPIWHRFRWIFKVGFPGGSDSKESICNSKDWGSTPGLGWSPGEGNGNLLQYSCLENSMDRGPWQATVHGVAKSGAQLSGYHFHFHFRWRSKVMRCKTTTVMWRRVGGAEWRDCKECCLFPHFLIYSMSSAYPFQSVQWRKGDKIQSLILNCSKSRKISENKRKSRPLREAARWQEFWWVLGKMAKPPWALLSGCN